MRLFITGIRGLVGRHVARAAAAQGIGVFGCDSEAVKDGGFEAVKADITKPAEISAAVARARPDAVIHAAAMTGVDDCERRRALASEVNVGGTANVCRAAAAAGAKLVFTSTAYVFDGRKGRYAESDVASPLNHYAETKRLAELEVLRLDDCAVSRLDVPYGWNPGGKDNFATWLVKSLRAGERVSVVGDQFNSPTYAPDLAGALLELCKGGYAGVYHTAGGDRISRLDFAVAAAHAFKLDDSLIQRCATAGLKQAAKRPFDCSLDSSRFERRSGMRMLGAGEGLRRMGSDEK